MIPFDFEYYRPSTVAEAYDTFHNLHKSGKKVIYFSGGTEFITSARVNKLRVDAVIDIKGIPDCTLIDMEKDKVVIGAAVSLNKIARSKMFPLLGQKIKLMADHSSRNKISLGGNINSQMIYREGILPLLITDATVKIASKGGGITRPLTDIFEKELKLEVGQLLVQMQIDQSYVHLPYVSLKKTRFSKVGYPIVSIAALVKDNRIRAAFSGVCNFPFRTQEIEAVLNDTSLSVEKRANEVIAQLPAPIVDDIQASADYREFVLINSLLETIKALEGEK